MRFEGGGGYRNIFTYELTSGPFAVRAAIDAERNIVYVGFSDGVIRWWNFSSESAVTNGTWPTSNWTCVLRGLEILLNHTLATACGPHVYLVTPAGGLAATLTFSQNISHFATAIESDLVVAGLESPPSVEIRNMSDGTLRSGFEVARTSWQVSSDAAARFIGTSDGGRIIKVFDTQAEANRTFSFPGSIFLPSPGSPLWVYQETSNDTYAYDTLLVFDEPFNNTAVASIPLGNGSSSRADSTEMDLYGTADGSAVAQFTVQHEYEYLNGQYRPGTNNRNLVLVYDRSGFKRGMAIPGEELSIKLLDDGSLLAVSTIRAVLGGSQVWLSRGSPDCTPPALVRHNITA